MNALTVADVKGSRLISDRFSVDVTRGAASPSASRLNDSSPNHDMDSSGSSLSSLSSLSSTPSSPAPTHAGAEDAGAATGAVLQQKSAAFGSESQQQQQVERLFFIKPIDSQGQSKSKDRLRDRGEHCTCASATCEPPASAARLARVFKRIDCDPRHLAK